MIAVPMRRFTACSRGLRALRATRGCGGRGNRSQLAASVPCPCPCREALPQVPDITEDCMTRYHNQETRGAFMCNFSKMLVKKEGRVRVYACTLVDDDPDYDLGGNLRESLAARVMLKHHRCYSCFALGSSCSEL